MGFGRLGWRWLVGSSSVLRWFALVAVWALAVSCANGDESGTAESPTTEERASTTSTAAPSSTSTTVTAQQIPAGPYYLPSDLPESWELVVLRFFSGDVDFPGAGSGTSGVETVSLVVHRSEGGFGGGAANLTVQRSSGDASFLPEGGFGFGEHESLEIPGLVSAELEYDDVQTGIGSVTAQVDERTSMSLIGDVSRSELIDIAGAVRFGDGDGLEVDVELDGWEVSSRGDPGESYILGLRGPEGSLEVNVRPGVSEATLHFGSSDLESMLDGEVGTGYHAVQRVESENLEFPSVRWWVPDAQLITGVGPDLDAIARILDGFVEVDEADFRAAIADVPTEVIELEPGPENAPSAPESEPLDPEVLARLVEVVETTVGREFDGSPSVSIADGAALRATVPDGSFVSDGLWDVLLALDLVDDDDSRADADAARRDQLRGVCCPVTVVDTGDPLFNEVVIVHELTHGLDTELGTSVGASVEVVDPVVALVEGNAHRVAFDYADVLNQQGADIPPPPSLFPPDGDPRVPPALRRVLEFPYQQGREFAAAVADQGGEAAIVDAFGQPPSSTEQILNPDAYLNGDDPATIAAPGLPDGATLARQGTLGAFILSLVAEPALGADDALDLALAWDGDAYILYETDNDQRCLAAAIQFDTAGHAQQAAEALMTAGLGVAAEQRTLEATRCTQM